MAGRARPSRAAEWFDTDVNNSSSLYCFAINHTMKNYFQCINLLSDEYKKAALKGFLVVLTIQLLFVLVETTAEKVKPTIRVLVPVYVGGQQPPDICWSRLLSVLAFAARSRFFGYFALPPSKAKTNHFQISNSIWNHGAETFKEFWLCESS